MEKNVFKKDIIARIQAIHNLSEEYNVSLKRDHGERLLELMAEHVEEIKELKFKNDNHFLTEIGDLIILCFELLIENNVSIDKKLIQCFRRYEDKLTKLIKGETDE